MEKRITKKYIEEKYNIDNERKMKRVERTVGNIDFSLIFNKDKMTKEDVLKRIEEELNKIDYDYIKQEHYGYDGGFELSLIKETEEPEKDKEVIERLKTEEKKKRKILKEIEKAKEILKKSNIDLNEIIN